MVRDIRSLVEELLGKEGPGSFNDLLRVQRRWKELVGEELGGKTKPYRLDNCILYIGVDSHAWAQELHYQSGEIKKRLSEEMNIEINRVIAKKINLK